MKHPYMQAAQDLDLFHMEEHSPGFVWWHPNGQRLLEALKQLLRQAHQVRGYEEVKTPNITSSELFERSGHLAKFGHNMFLIEQREQREQREQGDPGAAGAEAPVPAARQYAVRPMSCPNHIAVYADKRRSHAELPLKLFEFGEVVRNEASGALQALFRMRGFCQDDSHVFSHQAGVEAVLADYLSLAREVYAALGFEEVRFQISLRPVERFGDDTLWDAAEDALRKACAAQGLSWDEEPGGGAFYGPKLEMHLKDRLGRSWQCGTIQLDYVLPRRFGLEFVNAGNGRDIPVILHHAVLGSLERFVGILLEHHGCALPAAIRPVELALVSVRAEQDEVVQEMAAKLLRSGIRVRTVLGDDNLSGKVRAAQAMHPAHVGVVGAREAESLSVALRGKPGQVLALGALRELLRPGC